MATKDRFDGYSVNPYLDEDGDWLAHFVELPGASAFAETPEAALNELVVAWEGIKESYRKRGEAVPVAHAKKDYSGQLNVRIDKRVHRALAIEAAQAGTSLNAIIAQKLAQSVRHNGQH